jgi:hypothetical protein
MWKLSPVQVEEVCARYVAGETSPALAREFGVSGEAIRGLLDRRNIPRRTPEVARVQFKVNHSFFESVASEAQAYWLGFVAADGSISGNELSISLQTRDEEHLALFLNHIQSSHRIRTYTYDSLQFCRVSIKSRPLIAALARYAITSNKSFTLRWPSLSDTLLPHFTRGYVDGDGGFFSGKNPTFHVTSNEAFIQDLQSSLMANCNLTRTRCYRRHPESPIDTLRYVGRHQITRIFHYLYDGAHIWLPRKRSIIEPHLSI